MAAAMKRQNITIEHEVFNEFCKYAERQGIKFSPWVNQQMKNFIEEQKMIEQWREEQKRR